MLIQDEAKQFASEEGKKLPCLQYHPHRVKVVLKRGPVDMCYGISFFDV